jgi:hypothetical protein
MLLRVERTRAGLSETGVRPPRRSRAVPAMAGAVAFALCCAAFPIPCAAADPDFSDFRIPKNRALLWTGGLNTRANGQDFSVPSSQSSGGSLDGSASTRASWFSDSDPAFTLLDVDLQASGIRRHQDQETQIFTPTTSFLGTSESADRGLTEAWTLNAGHRRYPWTMPLGIEVTLSLGGNYSQSWHSFNSDAFSASPGGMSQVIQSNNSETWRYFNRAGATAGAGLGRVRNATGIYDAMVLEQRLRETGALTRPLSRGGRQRLAEVLYLRGALDAERERPGRVLWREIERVLAEDGALQEGGLDPYSVLRAAEPHLGASGGLTSDGVPISPMLRQTGAFVGLIVRDSHTNRLIRDDGESFIQTILNGIVVGTNSSTASSRLSQSQDRVDGGASGEIHVPISPPWQLDASGFVLMGLRKQDSYLFSDARLSLAWLAADRWTASANTAYQWNDEVRTEGATGADFWSWVAGLTVSWYVEDHTAIEFSAAENQFWVRGEDDLSSQHLFTRGLGASIGVTYRFSGWIATPGFFPALTTLPPASPAQP